MADTPTSEQDSGLPPGFYAELGMLLNLAYLMCRPIFLHPEAPLPRKCPADGAGRLLRCVQICSLTMLVPDLNAFFGRAATHQPGGTGSRMREMVGIIASGFVEIVRLDFSNTPEFEQAQQDIVRLADLV